MVIDDETAFTRLLKMSIEGMGSYVVHEENDPANALAAARSFRPDLVLVDIVMPGMDGGDVVAAFQSDPALKHIPTVFLTATVTATEVSENGLIGGRRFLAKPITRVALRQCIDQVVSAQQPHHAIAPEALGHAPHPH